MEVSKSERILGNPYVYVGEISKMLSILGQPFVFSHTENIGDLLLPGKWSPFEVLRAMSMAYHNAFNACFEVLASVKIQELESMEKTRGKMKDTLKWMAATYIGQIADKRRDDKYESYKKNITSSHDRGEKESSMKKRKKNSHDRDEKESSMKKREKKSHDRGEKESSKKKRILSHKRRSHRHKVYLKSSSERKISKKHYSDSSDSSDSSDGAYSSVSSHSSDSSVDKKLEGLVDKRILSLLKLSDVLGYPYEEYRPALNGITDQMSRDDVLLIMGFQYLSGRQDRFDAATRMDETTDERRDEENQSSKKKRKKNSRGTDERRGKKNESYKKKRKKHSHGTDEKRDKKNESYKKKREKNSLGALERRGHKYESYKKKRNNKR